MRVAPRDPACAARDRPRARRPHSRARACARLLAVALTASSVTGAQTGVDGDLVQRATVGPPAATAPTHASGASRTRQASFKFPATMQVLWRARVTGPVTLEPVVDDQGRIVLLHERGSLSMLSNTGTTSWSLRLGDATPGVSPALLSDGTIAIYNFDDRLLRIDATGHLVASTQLGLKGKPAALLPLESGGAALAVDDDLVNIDHRGEVVARARAEHVVTELLSARGSVIAVDKQGKVYRFHATGVLSSQGSIGRAVASVAFAGKSLFAVSGGQHLVSFELDSQTARTIYSAPATKTLQPWLALGPKTVYVAVSDGTLRGLSYAGRDRLSLVLGDSDPSRPGAALLPSATTPALADSGSRVMLASAGSETIIVEADGSHHRIPSSACLSPMSLTPMPRQRVLLVCRNGELLALAGARSPATEPATPPPAASATPRPAASATPAPPSSSAPGAAPTPTKPSPPAVAPAPPPTAPAPR